MSKSRKKQKTFTRKRNPAPADDLINRKLLGILQEDARATYAEIGQRAHLSAPAVYERIRRMQEAGVIQKHTVAINPAAVGLPFYGHHRGADESLRARHSDFLRRTQRCGLVLSPIAKRADRFRSA